MRMMMMTMMMSSGGCNNMDGSSDEHHVVVAGRMEMGRMETGAPDGASGAGLRLLDDNNGNRILYADKKLAMVGKEKEEEEEEGAEVAEEEQQARLFGDGDGDAAHCNHVYTLQQEQQLAGRENGDGEHHTHHGGGGGGGGDADVVLYAVGLMGNGGGGGDGSDGGEAQQQQQQQQQQHHHQQQLQQQQRHHQQQQQQLLQYEHHRDVLVEAKVGEVGNSGIRVGDPKLERAASEEGGGDDVGTATTAAHSPRTTTTARKSGAGRGRPSSSARDPAIEWSDDATTVLLQAFGDKYRALDRGNFTSKIWADIAARVNAHGMSVDGGGGGGSGGEEGTTTATPKTQEQCRIKVDNMKKRYKVEKEKKRVSGSTASKWPFFDTMEELIGSNPRLMRGGTATAAAAAGGGGGDLLGLENGGDDGGGHHHHHQQQQQQQPVAIRSSLEEAAAAAAAARMYFLEVPHGGEGDQTSETLPKASPVKRGKRKRALKDLQRENANAVSLRALFDGFNVPVSVVDAMVQEDVDESTLVNSKDVAGFIDQVRLKHRLHIKLGPAERIKQAIEARVKKRAAQ